MPITYVYRKRGGKMREGIKRNWSNESDLQTYEREEW